jgi:hypothetical protein
MFDQQAPMTWLSRFFCLILIATLGTTGCKPSVPSGKNQDGHDHHAEEADGPNGGHMVHLEPSDAHAEWVHDEDTGKLTVHLDEAILASKKIDGVRIELEVKGAPKKTYDLVANEKRAYELTSPELLTAIEVGAGDAEKVTATLIVTVDGKEESAKLEHHEHHH